MVPKTNINQIIILTSQKYGILSSSCLIPGIKTIQDAIRPKRRNREYTILVDVEFLHVGQALQHKPQAAVPQQQAIFAAQAAAEQAPKTAPILGKSSIKATPGLWEENKSCFCKFVPNVRLHQKQCGQR